MRAAFYSLFVLTAIVADLVASNVNASNSNPTGVTASYVRLVPTTLPATCNQGDLRVDGSQFNLQMCNGSNTWSAFGNVGGGGTGLNIAAPHSVIVGNGTSPFTQVGPGALGSVFIGNGAAADPAFFPVGADGLVLTADSTQTTGLKWGAGGTPPAATAATLGTVKSTTTVSHQFLTGLTTGTGIFTQSQPAFSDLTGAATAAQLPNPTASTLGGVESAAAVTHQWINSISTLGVPSLSQPAFTDISGNIAVSQMNSGTGASSTTFWRGDGTWQTVTSGFSNPMTTLGDIIYEDATPTAVRLPGQTTTTKKYLSQTGTGTISAVPSWQQIAFGDLSGSVASTQMPALTGDVTSSAGTVATTVAKLQGVAVANTAPSTNQVLLYNGTSWTPATAQSSGINWITTGDAETNSITGWTVYNDSAAQPVDCTGGTVVGTPLTTTATSPLSGTYSYLWTHGASNTQGQGFSYAFTLDSASATKVENTQFDMTVASGTWAPGTTSADGDQTVWIYDVDSSTLIQPTTYRLYSGTSGSFHFQTYWQPVNSTSRNYRLCVHNATTTATAYTTKFDSFSVAPSTYTYGTPITDWQVSTLTAGTNLTATTTNPAFGTVATNVLRWRRVGANMEFMVDYRQTGAGATAGTGSFLITLPNSAQIDTTLVTTNGGTTTNGYGTAIGQAWLSNAATGIASQSHIGQVIAWDSTHITARFKINASVADTWTSLLWGSSLGASQFNNANMTFHFSGSVPITGWSSGVQMSDSAPQTAVAARYALTSNQTGVNTNNSAVKVVFNDSTTAPDFDLVGGFSSGTYTTRVPGVYSFNPFITVLATNVLSAAYQLRLYKNGSYIEGCASINASSGSQFSLAGSCGDLNLVSGDTIDLYFYGAGNNSASTLTINGSTDSSYMSVKRLGDNRTLGATETVSARATSTAGQAFTNTDTVLDFPTVTWDDHGNVTTGASWHYTFQYPGKYSIKFVGQTAPFTCALGNAIAAKIYKSGSLYSRLAVSMCETTAASQSKVLSGSDEMNVVAGDTMDIRIAKDAGLTVSLSTTAGDVHISIVRVGN